MLNETARRRESNIRRTNHASLPCGTPQPMNVFKERNLGIETHTLEKPTPNKDALVPEAAPRPSQPRKQPESIEQCEAWHKPDSKSPIVSRALLKKSWQSLDRSGGQSSIAMQEKQDISARDPCAHIELLRAAPVGHDRAATTVTLGVLTGTIAAASIDNNNLERPGFNRESIKGVSKRGQIIPHRDDN